MALLQGPEPVLSDLLLALLVIGLHGYWIYALTTYDWSKFDEDSESDDFLKPLDNNPFK